MNVFPLKSGNKSICFKAQTFLYILLFQMELQSHKLYYRNGKSKLVNKNGVFEQSFKINPDRKPLFSDTALRFSRDCRSHINQTTEVSHESPQLHVNTSQSLSPMRVVHSPRQVGWVQQVLMKHKMSLLAHRKTEPICSSKQSFLDVRINSESLVKEEQEQQEIQDLVQGKNQQPIVQAKEFKIFQTKQEKKQQNFAMAMISELMKSSQDQTKKIKQSKKTSKKTQEGQLYFPSLHIASATLSYKPEQSVPQIPRALLGMQKREFVQLFQQNQPYVDERCYRSLKGVGLRCLYKEHKSSRVHFMLVLIHFEGVLYSRSRSFWNNQPEIQPCPSSSIYNLTCDIDQCPCQLRVNTKNMLHQLKQKAIVYLIFPSMGSAVRWDNYLRRNGFSYDAVYYIQNSEKRKPGQPISAGIKYSSLLQELAGSVYNIVILNSLPSEYLEAQIKSPPELELPFECFQQRVPLINQQCYNRTINMVYCTAQSFGTDALNLLDVAQALLTNSKRIISRNPLQIQPLFVDTYLRTYLRLDCKAYAIAQYQCYIAEQSVKQQGAIRENEQPLDWIERTEMLRSNLLDHIKSLLTVKVSNLHYMVGFLILRNHQFFKKYQKKRSNQMKGLFTQQLKKLNTLEIGLEEYIEKRVKQIPLRNNKINYYVLSER